MSCCNFLIFPVFFFICENLCLSVADRPTIGFSKRRSCISRNCWDEETRGSRLLLWKEDGPSLGADDFLSLDMVWGRREREGGGEGWGRVRGTKRENGEWERGKRMERWRERGGKVASSREEGCALSRLISVVWGYGNRVKGREGRKKSGREGRESLERVREREREREREKEFDKKRWIPH